MTKRYSTTRRLGARASRWVDLDPAPAPVQLVRPDDLLVLTVTFQGLRLSRAPTGALVLRPLPLVPGATPPPPRLRFDLPPQHIAEEVAHEVVDGSSGDVVLEDVALPPRAVLAGPSRLVVSVASEDTPISYSADGLLRALSAGALRSGDGEPSSGDTALELPWRLLVAPPGGSALTHPSRRPPPKGWVPLWFTEVAPGPLRALHSPDSGQDLKEDTPLPDGSRLETTLPPAARGDLVALTDRDLAPRANHLALSALGAWLDARGAWDEADVGLLEWEHAVDQGRDRRVKVVQRGYLYPLGHEAALMTVSERRLIAPSGEALGAAVLAKRERILLRERVLTFDEETDPACPFSEIEVLTTTTDLLDPRTGEPGAGRENDPPWSIALDPGYGFWARSGGRDVRFALRLRDRQGVDHFASIPLIFIKAGSGTSDAPWRETSAWARSSWERQPSRHGLVLGGRGVSFASPVDGEQHVCLPTSRLVLAGPVTSSGERKTLPRRRLLRPLLKVAAARVPAFERIAGHDGEVSVAYAPAWLARTAVDRAGVVLRFVDEAGDKDESLALRLGPDRAGAALNIGLLARGLARRFGPIGALESFADLDYTPADLFQPGSSLLGGFPLVPLLPSGSVPAGDGGVVPRLVASPDGSASLTLSCALQGATHGPMRIAPGADLTLLARYDAVTGDTSYEARFEGLELTVMESVTFRYRTVSYSSTGNAWYVDIDIEEVVAAAVMTYGEDLLKEAASMVGVDAEFGNGLLNFAGKYPLFPSIKNGLIEFHNVDISFTTTFNLETGASDLRLGVGERHAPCLASISGLGGSGHAAVFCSSKPADIVGGETPEWDTGGVELSFGGGGVLVLDLGVASGTLYATIGVLFSGGVVDGSTTQIEVAGSLIMGGELTVFGCVSVSASMRLSLGIRWKGDKVDLFGRAEFHVNVTLAFVEVGVSYTVERSVQGSDPPFTVQTPKDAWFAQRLALA